MLRAGYESADAVGRDEAAATNLNGLKFALSDQLVNRRSAQAQDVYSILNRDRDGIHYRRCTRTARRAGTGVDASAVSLEIWDFVIDFSSPRLIRLSAGREV